jgi:hypothetical protein
MLFHSGDKKKPVKPMLILVRREENCDAFEI